MNDERRARGFSPRGTKITSTHAVRCFYEKHATGKDRIVVDSMKRPRPRTHAVCDFSHRSTGVLNFLLACMAPSRGIFASRRRPKSFLSSPLSSPQARSHDFAPRTLPLGLLTVPRGLRSTPRRARVGSFFITLPPEGTLPGAAGGIPHGAGGTARSARASAGSERAGAFRRSRDGRGAPRERTRGSRAVW